MTFRPRLAAAAFAASSLLLAGCAVPGQGTPGVALTVDETTVTTAELDALAAQWAEDSDGLAVPDRRALATFAAMGPELLAATEAQGAPIREADALTITTAWFENAGATDPEPSDEVVESSRAMLALYVLAYSDPTFDGIREIADRAAAEGEFSPRVGEFSSDALIESINAAVGTAESAGLGNFSFITFLGVSGFSDTTAPWAARG
ncbi:MAG: hypothetical protein ACLGHM_04165 [Actinomycetes bacterium]